MPRPGRITSSPDRTMPSPDRTMPSPGRITSSPDRIIPSPGRTPSSPGPRNPRTDRKAVTRSQDVTPTGLTRIINIQLTSPSRTGPIPITARTRGRTSSQKAASALPGMTPGPIPGRRAGAIRRVCPTRIWQNWTAGLKPMVSWR